MDFYVASYEVVLLGTTVREYLYLNSQENSHFRAISTTQSPSQYGGNIFHTAAQLSTVMELASKDYMLNNKVIEVRRVRVMEQPLSNDELQNLERMALTAQLSPRQQKILGIKVDEK